MWNWNGLCCIFLIHYFKSFFNKKNIIHYSKCFYWFSCEWRVLNRFLKIHLKTHWLKELIAIQISFILFSYEHTDKRVFSWKCDFPLTTMRNAVYIFFMCDLSVFLTLKKSNFSFFSSLITKNCKWTALCYLNQFDSTKYLLNQSKKYIGLSRLFSLSILNIFLFSKLL